MKSFVWFLFLAMLGLGLTTAFSRESSNIRIEFVHPERFSPCLTLFGLETAPSRGKNRQPPKILVTMKSDNLFIFCDNI